MAKPRDEVTWFDSPARWRAWLEVNHAKETELWVGLRKKHVAVGITWQEAVDEALCFGWIDGLTHTVDADGYTCRVTPRKPRSIWSAVNLKRIEELIAAGRVHPAGLRFTRNGMSRALDSMPPSRRRSGSNRSRRRRSRRTKRPGRGSSRNRPATSARQPGGWSAPNARKRVFAASPN